MSRLIDADDLIIEILTHDLIGDDKEVDKIILDAPTVKAISVKWIKNYASHKASKDLIDCYWHFWEDDVLKMVADWEEENEKSGISD